MGNCQIGSELLHPTCDSRKIITLTPKGLNLSNILYGVMRVNNLVNT